MNIYPPNSILSKKNELSIYSNHIWNTSGSTDTDTDDRILSINLQQELNDAAEEMADVLSLSSRRFSKIAKKNDNSDNDGAPTILEDNVDGKFNYLVKQIPRLRNVNDILSFARSMFPNDSDLVIVLRELLHSRRLSTLQKEKVKEVINDLDKFGDRQKIQSGINIGKIAKKFSGEQDGRRISPADLRNAYLLFLELNHIPATYIFQGWIEEYGVSNRKRLLTFTLSALVADMKANEPGIHFSEFGPLSSKLSDARILHSLDESVIKSFESFTFREQMRKNQVMLEERDIIGLYMTGLTDSEKLRDSLQSFELDFMSLLRLKERSVVMHTIRNLFNLTPDFLYSDIACRNAVLDVMLSALTNLYGNEIDYGIFQRYCDN